MAPFADDDRSIEGSAPIEVFTFTSQRAVDPVVARSTSWHRDVVFGGFTYTARPIRRGATAYENVSANLREMTVEVPVTDPTAQFYLSLGSPPQKFDLHIRRIQQTSGGDERVFRGNITECRVKGRTATFTITQKLDEPLATKFPSIQVSKRCQHVLYDGRCGVLRSSNDAATTISNINDFRSVSVASTGGFPLNDFRRGEIVHTPSGERRAIVTIMAPDVLVLDVRLPSTAANSDAVTIYRGCDRTVVQCLSQHSNVPNFGGNPHFTTDRGLFTLAGLLRTPKI